MVRQAHKMRNDPVQAKLLSISPVVVPEQVLSAEAKLKRIVLPSRNEKEVVRHGAASSFLGDEDWLATVKNNIKGRRASVHNTNGAQADILAGKLLVSRDKYIDQSTTQPPRS